MTPETLSRATEPFLTTKGHGQGTGLGLATVYGIVNQLGGVLRIESSPARGAVVTIFLPTTAIGRDWPALPAGGHANCTTHLIGKWRCGRLAAV